MGLFIFETLIINNFLVVRKKLIASYKKLVQDKNKKWSRIFYETYYKITFRFEI